MNYANYNELMNDFDIFNGTLYQYLHTVIDANTVNYITAKVTPTTIQIGVVDRVIIVTSNNEVTEYTR